MEAGLLMRNLFGLAYHLRIKLIKLKAYRHALEKVVRNVSVV